VFAVVENGEAGTSSVVRSDVGSDDWRPVDVGTPIVFATQLARSENVTALLASPTQTSTDNEVFVSSDDGENWVGGRDPCTGKTFPNSISTSEGALWTVCVPRAGRTGATAYVSTDAGGSWTPAEGSFGPGIQIQARDATAAFVLDVNESGATLVTVDGEPERKLVGEGNFLAVGFTTPSTGYLQSYEYRIIRTQDSGATWQDYPTPP
jgi:hypothetical protein